MESKTKVYGKIIKKKWKVGKFISEGGNGSVYECVDIETKRELAIKFEDLKSKSLIAEIKIYRLIEGMQGIPKIYGSGVYKDLRFLVMERLIPIEEINKEIAIKLFKILEDLAKKGYSHNDIKSDNVMLRDNGDVVLIDFGMYMKIGDVFNEPVQAILCLMGLDAHMGIVTARNDIESLVYSMEKTLPWEYETSFTKTLEMKKKFIETNPLLSRLHGIDYEALEKLL